MFKLTSKLALSNLKQNRKLYYPFALAVILTTMILYSFIALSSTPHLEDSYGGGAARTVLGFGSFVVQLVVIILVAYANGYVMKIVPKNWDCTVFWEWRRSTFSS